MAKPSHRRRKFKVQKSWRSDHPPGQNRRRPRTRRMKTPTPNNTKRSIHEVRRDAVMFALKMIPSHVNGYVSTKDVSIVLGISRGAVRPVLCDLKRARLVNAYCVGRGRRRVEFWQPRNVMYG